MDASAGTLLGVTVLALCASIGAQDGTDRAADEVGLHAERSAQLRAAALAVRDYVDDDGVRRTAAPPAHDLAQVVRASVSALPRRIAPGAAGEVAVVVAFTGDLVVGGPRGFDVRYHAQQGPLRLGAHAITPRAGPYRDTATITVPVAVDSSAAPGTCPVAFLIEAEVTHAPSGRNLGLHRMVCSGTLEVGEPLPAPPLRVAGAAGEGRTESAPDAAPADGGAPAHDSPSRDAGASSAVLPERSHPRPGGPPAPASLPIGLLAGSGAFVVLLLALVVRRATR